MEEGTAGCGGGLSIGLGATGVAGREEESVGGDDMVFFSDCLDLNDCVRRKEKM